MSRFRLFLVLFLTQICLWASPLHAQRNALVFQTDFGVKDGAVAAMKGVAFGVSDQIPLFDLTHEIPPYDIWQAAYRLQQTIAYWPAGTVFVSVVDPGVGSDRKSVVAKTKSGHFIVSPDNGTLTLIAHSIGIDSLRQIDERLNRLPGSSESYTFHGRDVYAYTGARLAAGVIEFYQIGPVLPPRVVELPYQPAARKGQTIQGNIPVLDIQYGNIWTNIPQSMLKDAGIRYGDRIRIRVLNQGKIVYSGEMIYGTSFSSVPKGKPVAYLNSLLNLAFGINMGNFSEKHKVAAGSDWSVMVEAKKPN
jgi:S-adenosylmethionine hydrolase